MSDEESIKMSRLILKEEGIFIGSSSAVNLVASYKFAQNLINNSNNNNNNNNNHYHHLEKKKGEGDSIITLVTILCDSGNRHLSKFWNDQFLIQNGFLS